MDLQEEWGASPEQRIADLERELNTATHGGCGKPGHTTSPTDPLEGEDSTAYCLTCKLERELAEERENNSANANNVARLLHENLQLEEALAEARGEIERVSGLHNIACDNYVTLTDELWHIFGEQDRRDYAVQAKEIMAELAEMTADRNLWQDAHNDDCPNKAMVDTLTQELAEVREAAEWERITPENMPNWAEITVTCVPTTQQSMRNNEYHS